MAHGIFGTFTTGQWNVFRAFSIVQKVELQLRKIWLEKEISKIGIFTTEYGSDYFPVSFTATPGSYADKLMQAYRILGGVPERDMLLRTSDKPVFLNRGAPMTKTQDGQTTSGVSDSFSNGRRIRGTQRFDRDLGLRVDRLKKWQLESIKQKLEHLEFKIKRALDYSDQLQRELVQINLLMGSDAGSVDDQILQVEISMATPGAANTVQNDDDIFGLFIGTPADLTFPNAEEIAQQGDQRLP